MSPHANSRRAHGSREIDNDIGGSGRIADGITVSLISRQPSIEMNLSGQQIALVPIALLMSQHQVVSEVTRVTRPRHEMVDLAAVDPALAVQTLSFLNVGEWCGHAQQR